MNLPLPASRQLAWHELEYYCFIHFTTNTFTDKEWGFGDESPSLFNPTDFDADDMVTIVREAGMKGLILTCKHHDGFCLWPSRVTEYSVARSPFRNGEGDVVFELSDACRRHGIRFGIYLSPWDRNHAQYGSPAYIEYFRQQLHELTTEYGEIFEVWFDGANGGDGYYGGANETRSIDRTTYYDWDNTRQIVRDNQPQTVMFSDAGPDVRWVGNEKGIAGDPCWSTINQELIFPGIDPASFEARLTQKRETGDMVDAWDSPTQLLNCGDRNGANWLPAEADVSIRPGWFFHSSENDRVRTPENLFDLYLKSVGRGTSLLLNLPPDRRGRIHEIDQESRMGFKAVRVAMFASDCISAATVLADSGRVEDLHEEASWLQAESDHLTLTCTFTESQSVGIVGLREQIHLGQRVDSWSIEVHTDQGWRKVKQGEAIGNRRLIDIGHQRIDGVRICILGRVAPAIRELALYDHPLRAS
ncbi:MAG: alpha-L-fucosidase [Candidatus Latescibacterota bacterium]|nr:alpha-L-fucosidase [Candidatus Latescibacterota bacterium]